MIRSKIPVMIFLALMISSKANAQVSGNVPGYLYERLSSYCKAFPWEDAYVQTDRNQYIAGEDLWFSVYVINRLNNSPSAESRIAYVEVLNPSNVPIVQKRIGLTNGSGPGYISLPDSLSTGKYILRAYTNWMKNFLPGNCFVKEIFIYNGLKNKVLKSKPFGTGLNINTAVNARYEGSAVSLVVNNSRSDSLEIIINAEESFRSQNNNLCYLLINTHGIISRLSQINLRSARGRVAISRNELISGINDIAVFSSKAIPVAEKYICIKPPASGVLNVKAPETAGLREKIRLDIQLPSGIADSLKYSTFSISVIPASAGGNAQGLSDYMVFGSEFGILPEKIRNSTIDEVSTAYIDSLLTGCKSRWIDWKQVLQGEMPAISFYPENFNHYLTGRLFIQNTEVPDSFKFVLMSVPGKVAGFQYCTTDREGRFEFSVPLDKTLKDFVIQPLLSDKTGRIKIESGFSASYPVFNTVFASTAPAVPESIKKLSTNYQVNRIYGSSWLKMPEAVRDTVPSFTRFYGKPDIELKMDDYIKLPVMSEVFFELIPGVFLKNRKSVWEITMADPEANRIYDEDPMLMVDGVIIDQASKIANLDPELVEKIEVIKERYLVGDFLFFGIVNVITRAGDFSNVTLPDNAVRFPYRAAEPVNTFSFPDYSASELKKRRIPDFRNTLFWNPSVVPDKDGRASAEFWSSDVSDQYMIDIQGFASDGTRFSVRRPLTIK